MTPKADLPIRSFRSREVWERWLAAHHARSDGIWLKFHKKTSGKPTVTHAEALDEALCYGWIDGQIRPFDERSWLHKFTPRRARSVWSKRNTEHVTRLIAAGRVKPAGLREVEAAKAAGRWQRAYDSQRSMSAPDDFLQALAKDTNAKAFFETLNKANVYAIVWRLQTAAKPETREKRLKAIIAMLASHKSFHGTALANKRSKSKP